ncbi:MAG: cell division protein FtsB [Methylococcaceae bacterium]|nr:cell division protein FtsB [Methylococcaceae bacterium]
MKFFVPLIIVLIGLLQYRLWVGDGSVAQINEYQQRLDELKLEADKRNLRNESLRAEVLDIKKGQEAIEERARYELGMIREDETFFQIVK